MSKIVGIGANVYDTLITLPDFPEEDTKLRANSVCVTGGGPCATGLVAASKLGAESAYIGVLSQDNSGDFLAKDMLKYGVTDKLISREAGSSFSSCIWLNLKNATRTCVFDKGTLPPLVLNEKQKQAISDAEVLMIDGNEMSAAIEGAKIANKSNTKVLYDAGGLYEGVENLLPYADILIPSEEFALKHTNENDAGNAAKKLMELYKPSVVVITQGKKGGIIYDGDTVKNYTSFEVDAKDTNGAGDVFHGAFAFALTKKFDYYKCCIFASAVSALKCTKIGARESVPDFNETVEFLKENGYEF